MTSIIKPGSHRRTEMQEWSQHQNLYLVTCSGLCAPDGLQIAVICCHCHFLACHNWTFPRHVIGKSNYLVAWFKQKDPKQPDHPKQPCLGLWGAKAAPTRSTRILYILWDFDHSSMIDSIFFIQIGFVFGIQIIVWRINVRPIPSFHSGYPLIKTHMVLLNLSPHSGTQRPLDWS